MKWFGRSIVALVIIAGIGLAIYSQQPAEQPPAQPAPMISQSPETESSATPSPSPTETLYPVPTESSEAKLPTVDESDDSIVAELSRLIGKEKFEAIFNPKNIVRRIVVSVDNATKHAQISQEFSPFKPLEKNFKTLGKGEELAISPANYSRYSNYIALARLVDTGKLATLYIHFYPLFQSAYQDLGVKGYFNDRLIAAIDVVLETPKVTAPIKLVRAPVHPVYKFADEKLEALPAVQKALLRMGTENAMMIQAKLRELRELFIHFDQTGKQATK